MFINTNLFRFIGSFLSDVQQLDRDLALISNILSIWNQVQLKWMFLEAIFLDDKFRSELMNEAIQFDELNQKLKLLMQNILKNPKIISLTEKPELFLELNQLLEGFEMCQKSLNKYLGSKRNSFPRFYFLSDNELLLVFGNSNPNCIQEHIVKMFDNVESILLTHDLRKNILVHAMISCEKEKMDFKSEVLIEGPIESWMMNVLIEMWRSNKFLTKKSIFDYGNVRRSRCEWMLDHQGQMCLAANSVWWTAEVENVFMEMKYVCILCVVILKTLDMFI